MPAVLASPRFQGVSVDFRDVPRNWNSRLNSNGLFAFSDGVRPVDEVEATSVPVAGKDQTISGMAGRYATALFELALENKAVDAVKKDLDQFDALIADSADLNRLVRSPVFGADEQLKA